MRKVYLTVEDLRAWVDEYTPHYHSGIKFARPVTFTFADNGDLVDITPDRWDARFDASLVGALIDDARAGRIGSPDFPLPRGATRRNPRERISAQDVTVEKVMPSGAIRVSAMVGSQWVHRTYYEFTRREAVREFLDDVRGGVRRNPSPRAHPRYAAGSRTEVTMRDGPEPEGEVRARYADGDWFGQWEEPWDDDTVPRAARPARFTPRAGAARSSAVRVNGARMRLPVQDFASARAALDRLRGGRLGHNTTLEVTGPDSIAVILHRTPIVTYHRDGQITLNSGGYQTVTTKARMNEVLPQYIRVFQKARAWQVRDARDGATLPFRDGMTFRHS